MQTTLFDYFKMHPPTEQHFFGNDSQTFAPNSVKEMMLIYSHNHSNHSGNDSIDVALKGCFHNFDPVACGR